MIIGTSRSILSGLVSRVKEDMRDPKVRNAYIGTVVGMVVSIPCGPLAMMVFPVTGTIVGGLISR